MFARLAHGTDNIRRSTRSGNAYQRVSLADIVRQKIEPSLLYIVLGPLDRIAQGRVAAGYDSHHHRRRHAERRRNLRGIQNTQTATCARTDIEQTAAATHAFGQQLHEACNLRQSTLDCIGHAVVLAVYGGNNLRRTHGFEVVVM